MTDALLRSRVQPWASWVHSHPFKLLLETHKTCQWIGPLGQGTEARERAHALENKRRRIYLPIVSFPHTGNPGQAELPDPGWGTLAARGKDPPPHERKCLGGSRELVLPPSLPGERKIQSSGF